MKNSVWTLPGRRVLFCLILLIMGINWCSAATIVKSSQRVYDKILINIFQYANLDVNLSEIERKTAEYLNLMDENGAFRDIDYSLKSQTNWKPMVHLERLQTMSQAYVMPKSSRYGQQSLYQAILKMLNCWYIRQPQSTNWYYREIGWPQRMGNALCLLRFGKEKIPRDLECLLLNRMKDTSKGPDQKGSQGIGANKMDIALQWFYRTVLQEDSIQLSFAVDQFFFPIQYNDGQGIQRDYSYLQHGPQLYTGGYGAAVLNAFLKMAYYLKDTPFEKPDKNDIFYAYVRKGVLPTLRGKFMLYNVLGRGVARKHATLGGGLIQCIKMLTTLDSLHKPEYIDAVKHLEGCTSRRYLPLHRHFWRADYSIHRRPQFTMDVRMSSTRTNRCENGNAENLKGYFMTDGGTSIVCEGDEYYDIFPVWDWSHIPGTTTPSIIKVPQPSPWGHRGQSRYCGGVSDGEHGVSAFCLDDMDYEINTFAKKSWFFLGDEIICMGAEINSSNENEIHTTINQCLKRGTIRWSDYRGVTKKVQANQVILRNDVRSVTHDKITYWFPKKVNLEMCHGIQEGCWKDISISEESTTSRKEVFKLWINHGRRPIDGRYEYYILPPAQKSISQRIKQISTVNTDKVQAVWHKGLGLLGATFYGPGVLELGPHQLRTDGPCLILLHLGKNIRGYVSDPTCRANAVNISYKKIGDKKSRKFHCTYHKDNQMRGATESFCLNE